MATISSHVLDSVVGTHASGIRVRCYQLLESGSRSEIFDVLAGSDGRIAVDVKTMPESDASEIELVFYSRDYYASLQPTADAKQIMNTVVVRLNTPDPSAKYHVPIMLSPYSYSVWWSGTPKPTAST